MRQQRHALLDRSVVAELQFRRARAAVQPLQPATHRRRQLARVPEAHGRRHRLRRGGGKRGPGGAVEIAHDHRPLGLALLRVRKDLARPLRQPAIGQLDLAHAHRTGVGQVQQQRMRVGRIAGNADRVRREVIRHRGHRAVKHFRQPVVGVQFLPQRGRGDAPRQAVDQQQLLADVQAALQQFRLHAGQVGVALEQGFEARRILFP
jgi:hypothetical protein